jgi:hypothetical protein
MARLTDAEYWEIYDNLSALVSKGYIDESEFDSRLKRVVEKRKGINSNDKQERDGNP